MRTLSTAFVTLLLAAPLAAQADPDKPAAGGGSLPAGWQARLDRADAKLADLKFAPMGNGLHATSGPHAIYWRDADRVTGDFHAVATFTRTKATPHPEAYGMFVGGADLPGPKQSYTYLLIRGDGKYMIRKREGATTSNVAAWTDNPAVAKADSAGKATDQLEIEGKGGKLIFKVNGTAVHEMDGSAAGIVGLRVSHNLDVHIAGFAVHKM